MAYAHIDTHPAPNFLRFLTDLGDFVTELHKTTRLNAPPTRRCADCRRDFEYHQEYQGSPRGVVCRNRRRCAERAGSVNGRRGKLYVHTIFGSAGEAPAPAVGERSELYVHTISGGDEGMAR